VKKEKTSQCASCGKTHEVGGERPSGDRESADQDGKQIRRNEARQNKTAGGLVITAKLVT